MVSIDKIETGVAKFLDEELMPQLADNSLQKVLTGAAIGIIIKRKMNIVNELRQNTFIKMLDIFDKDGNVDIDILKDELLRNMPNGVMNVDIKFLGPMDITKDDVLKLYKYITE